MEAQRVRWHLERILGSAAFTEAECASRFLRYVVERKLEGRAAEIKESVIAVDVLGRNSSSIRKPIPSCASRRDGCATGSILITKPKARRTRF